MLAPTTTRVTRQTASGVNERISAQTQRNIERFGGDPAVIERRLAELEREWDIERALEAEAPATILAGLALGTLVDRRFLALSAFAAGMLLLHNVQGWYPLLPLLRRLGFRTAREIADEAYALKAARGDLHPVAALGTERERAVQAYRAAAWR